MKRPEKLTFANWHGSCNPKDIQAGPSGRSTSGSLIMSYARFQTTAFALLSAVVAASLFIGAAVPIA